MSPELIGVLGLVLLLVLIFLRMWIGLAMAFVGFFGFALIRGLDPAFLLAAKIPYTTVAYYTISTIPLFILMGVVIYNSGIGRDLYETVDKWVGQYRGGLAIATIIACAIFGAITGISAAALSSIGKIAHPEMKRLGYSDSLATGSIVSAGTLAILIPPSIAFIIYGILTEQSIGKLFIAGITPGILLTILFIVAILFVIKLNPASGPKGPKHNIREKLVSLKYSWPVFLLFVIVLGGIYMGIFTPTEAGGIGAFGAIIIGFAYRRLSFKALASSLFETAQTTAMVMILMIGAYFFMKFLGISKLPFLLSEYIAGLPVSPIVIFIGIIILYIVLGMFLDIFSAVILTIPILYPLVISLGFDPIWFGVMVVLVIQMGLITPPVGLDVFILSGITGVPSFTIFRGVIPFFIAIVVCIVVLTAFPQAVLFIPNIMK